MMSKLLPILLLLLLSQGALLAQAPEITQPPVAQTVTEGQGAQFTVAATGSNLLYQWLKDGDPLTNGGRISGALAATLTISSTLPSDAGSYSVVVSVSGSPDLKVSSDGVLLKVNPPMPPAPQITQQPAGQTVIEGQNAQVTVVATGSNLLFQWAKDGVALIDGARITGATTATLNITGALEADEGSYSVVVTVSGFPQLKAGSDGALLKVDPPPPTAPQITQPPIELTVAEGQTAQFTVVATGMNLIYQWAKDGVALIDGGRITGATTATLTLTGAQSLDEGAYSVVVSVSGFPELKAGSNGVLLQLLKTPEIVVEYPVDNELVNGVSSIDFGSVFTNSSADLTFTIRNSGDADLTGLNVFPVTQANQGTPMFALTYPPISPVAPGGSTTFTLRFAPTSVGVKTLPTMRITSNDTDESPFDMTLTGTGLTTAPGKLAMGGALFTVNEETETVNIPITRSGGTDGAVTAMISTTNGTAIAGSDYTALSNHLVTFASGESAKNVSVTISNPAGTNEPTETFTVTLSNPTAGATLGTQKTATVVILDSEDATPPTTPTITAPLANAKLNVYPGGAVTITGTAKDNQRVASVEASLDNGATFTPAMVTLTGSGASFGTTATYTVNLTPMIGGTNTVLVRTTDISGLTSPTPAFRSFIVNRLLMVNLVGTGTVTTGYAGATFREVGKNHAITATPKTGYLFNGWAVNNTTGTGITTAKQELPALTFVMQDSLVLTANFIPNPFTPALVGSFNGLVIPDETSTPGVANVGLINLLLGTKGSFTGSLKIDGTSLSTPGFFDNTGMARFGSTRSTSLTLKRTGKPDLIVRLQLDMSGVSGRITGSVTQKLGAVIQAVSNIDADRAHYSMASALTKVPATLAGTTTKPYTLVFPSKTQTPAQGLNTYPQGDGYATMTVNVNGTVSLTGKLADHTPITATAPLSKNNQWPIFAQLYATKGSFAGLATLTDADDVTEDVSATDLLWFRPFQNVQWYKNGWPSGITIDLFGARYVVPPALPATSVFPGLSSNSPNATLSFTDGLLAGPISQDITISTANLVVSTSPTLVITKASGLISGTFIHSDLTKPAYQGVIVQKGANQGGHGYFMSRATPLNFLGESGRVQVLAK